LFNTASADKFRNSSQASPRFVSQLSSTATGAAVSDLLNNRWRLKMKKLLSALIVTTVIGAPVFAQVAAVHRQAPTESNWQTSPNSVYNEGEYRGTDPDPQVRLDLRRESPHDGS
jgi:hypothetical protein